MSDTLVAPASAPPAAKPVGRVFLPVFDGMRGFFGIYIGLAHVFARLTIMRPGGFAMPDHFVGIGHNAVGMFIVISGYVLGLPVARAGQVFRGGLWTYAKRRARRILPAYYAALALSLAIVTFTAPIFGEQMGTHWLISSTVLHVLMLHNFANSAISTIDGPMWSVAVECDIYVLFPLLMVPAARRFGFTAMVLVAFAVSLLPTLLGALHHEFVDYRFAETCPWFVGLFALGYAAANFSIDPRPAAVRRLATWPWGRIAAGLAVATLVAVLLTPGKLDLDKGGNGIRWYADILLGLAIAAQFTADAQARMHGRRSLFERFFTWQPLLFLGTFSYSFYLLHIPVSDLVMSFARPDWSNADVLALTVPAFALALIVSYIFYRIAEKPFMTEYRRRGDAASLRSTNVTEIPDDGYAAPARGVTGG